MTTFSQLVDEMAAEILRPDLKRTGAQIDGGYIASSINQTIREVHSGKGGIAHRFDANRQEFELIAPSDAVNHYNYPIESFNRFQAAEAAFYPVPNKYAKPAAPGIVNINQRGPIEDLFYFYQSGQYMTFHGFGPAGSKILFSAFYYPRSLVYHLPATRWATYDVELETWTYKDGTGKTNEELQDLSTNWILMRWTDLIREGVRAKVYKRLGDEVRQRTSYSSYESMRAEMQIQEVSQGTGYYAQ